MPEVFDDGVNDAGVTTCQRNSRIRHLMQHEQEGRAYMEVERSPGCMASSVRKNTVSESYKQ